jgi:glycosyltransferase involved in cell wall biosynthesis
MVAAIDRLMVRGDLPDRTLHVICPRDADIAGSPYAALRCESFGHLTGHLWEQLELPYRARDGALLNLANTAPVLHGRQLIVIHDAAIYAVPKAYGTTYRLWHKFLHSVFVRSNVRIATVSRFSASELSRYLAIAPSRVLGPTFEGADHILRVQPDRDALSRHQLAERKYALAVGSLALHKNLHALTLTAVELMDRGMTLAIAGSTNPDVFAGAAGAGGELADVRYLGRVDDAELRALYQGAVCFLFPSRYEGFGIPPIEAMTCGCPVIAATAGATMETCQDAALYCDPDDPEAFASAVSKILRDEGTSERLRECGRRRAREFTWDKAAERLIATINETAL